MPESQIPPSDGSPQPSGQSAPSGQPKQTPDVATKGSAPSASNAVNSVDAAKPISSKSSSTNVSSFRLFRNRIIAGLFVVLPIFITYGIIKWLYELLNAYLIAPLANMFLFIWSRGPDGGEVKLPWFVESIGAPGAAIALALGTLMIAGMFFRSRLHRSVDWVLSNVPGVSTVYNAVSNVFDALSRSQNGENFKRVVLVPFPHPGMRVPAFVTSECTDESSGREILCVYVPTTPVPTSGYMILVPAEDVVEINWDIQETLQAIVSGGITVPATVTYDTPPPISIQTTPKV